MSPKYRKRPVVVDAVRWTGGPDQEHHADWLDDALRAGTVWFLGTGTPQVKLHIRTLEGNMTASPGDYVIRGVKGEIYPCKPDIFEATYEAAS